MRSVFDTCLVLIFAISGYFGTINSYGIFRSKSRTMTKSGCVYDGRVVLDGETIAIPGSCQTLKCYGNKFQKSNKDCATITSATFKCLPGTSHTDQSTCVKSTCFVDHQGYSMKHTRGCKINGNCVFPSDFKDAFGLRFLCHHMRCTRKGFVRSQKKSLCSRDDVCRTTRWIDAYK
ncbi:uncharacterized protein LOC125680264 isoform X2 [Ostrea edulis]|nr:uncharacterized protein LOC125680264 isoform X2 [Ostrea edulis]